MVNGFVSNGIPELIFGRDVFQNLPQRLKPFGTRVLLVGGLYAQNHPSLIKDVTDHLMVFGHTVTSVSAGGKQTEEAAKQISADIDVSDFDCVISIGGSRAIDVGKLLSDGLPHIAIPTTAGTGAAMNGVIFGGESAYEETQKASLVPSITIGDPSFIDEMARDDFASRALGVLTLLMEAYVSPKASVLSDALIWSGLEAFARGFVAGVEGETWGRDDVFYASLIAGVGSGQAGFGLTHQLAAAIEQKTSLSYAQSSATICAEITDIQIDLLSDRLPDAEAMDKYAMIGELLAGRPFEDREEAYASLIGTLRRWVARLEMEKMEISPRDLSAICQNQLDDWDDQVLPVRLSEEEMMQALLRRSSRT
ncbi:iron-containing alcohol dehydrogenase [Terasakiella sp. A23]|uniref:iron-containing alcohol dehydrogenase n=1 Tax=Terasakiella sp. FCG-A23 TaxID=3080561 RepID=UPI002954171D|nr:iron-containing alcohol dehydrogenase [Terasakiella sp. A23]MDV7341547.1 iron-containing alcohol dehydrogenase [Terasakiella sp. A23]